MKLAFVPVAVIAAGALAGCDGGGSEADTYTITTEAGVPTETTEVTPMSDPIRCLDAAGLVDVEGQDVDLWRGFDDGRSYAITVHRLATPAKALTVVAGAYAVAGPFKVAAEGEGLSVQEGLEADALVQDVAACLSD